MNQLTLFLQRRAATAAPASAVIRWKTSCPSRSDGSAPSCTGGLLNGNLTRIGETLSAGSRMGPPARGRRRNRGASHNSGQSRRSMGVARYVGVFAALGDPDPDYDAVSFAVRNLGFIKFEVIRQSVVEIELHPRNIELPALLAVQQQLLVVGSAPVPDQVFRHELAFRDLVLGRGDDRAPVRVVRAALHADDATSGFSSSRRISGCCSRRSTTRSASSRRNGASRSGISTRTSSRWRCATSFCRGWRSSA